MEYLIIVFLSISCLTYVTLWSDYSRYKRYKMLPPGSKDHKLIINKCSHILYSTLAKIVNVAIFFNIGYWIFYHDMDYMAYFILMIFPSLCIGVNIYQHFLMLGEAEEHMAYSNTRLNVRKMYLSIIILLVLVAHFIINSIALLDYIHGICLLIFIPTAIAALWFFWKSLKSKLSGGERDEEYPTYPPAIPNWVILIFFMVFFIGGYIFVSILTGAALSHGRAMRTGKFLKKKSQASLTKEGHEWA